MAATRFTKMAYASADEMTFGLSNYPEISGLAI